MMYNYKYREYSPDKNGRLLQPWWSIIFCLALLMIISTISLAQTGTVPVNPPPVGFNIDGGLKVNSSLGDWVAGSVGTGGFVFNNDGTTVPGYHGMLIRDQYNNNSDIIFAEGSKFNSSPADWSWMTGTASDKSDINNAMYLVTTDPNTGDSWIIIGGDRLSTNGTSYIDFEFLQKPITRNLHNNKFTSAGEHGGRTVNDISITMGYSSGGSNPVITVYVWQPAARGGGYEYKEIPASALSGKIFAATNTTVTDVPFLAFGSPQYKPFAFIEAAINISVLFGAINPCTGINVDNVIIKTKASDSETAALKDFVEPIPVNLSFGTAEISYDPPVCNKGTANVNFTVGSVRGGTFSAPAGLSIDATTGQIDLAKSTPGNYTITYSFETNGCPRSVTTDITVLVSPDTPSLEAVHPICSLATGAILITSPTSDQTFSVDGGDFVVYPEGGFSGLAPGTHTVVAKNAAGCISDMAEIVINAQPITPEKPIVDVRQPTCDIATAVISVTSSTDGLLFSFNGGEFKEYPAEGYIINAGSDFTLVAKGATECTSEAVSGTINEQPATPTANAGHDKVITCSTATVQLDGSSSTVGVEFAWIASNGGNIVSGANTATPIVDAAGTYTLMVTNPLGGCSATDVVVVTEDATKPSANIYSGDLPPTIYCNTISVTLSGSTNIEGAMFSWSGPEEFSSDQAVVEVTKPGIYTFTVTNPANGCIASKTVEVYDGRAYPNVNAGPDKILNCATTTVTLEGSSEDFTDGLMHLFWTASDGGNIVSGATTFNPVVDAPGTYTLTIKNMRIGCTSTDIVVVTREGVVPTVSAKGGSLSCATGSLQLQGSSSTDGVSYMWTGPNDYTSSEQNPIVTVAGEYTLTVTHDATGCKASTSVVVNPVAVPTEPVVRCHTMGFDYNDYNKGLISTINTVEGTVAVMGRKRNPDGSYAAENHAAIFDTQAPTGDDTDLYTTNWGQALIINQDLTSVPNDNQWGGELILDFSAIGPVTMESLKALDIDSYEGMSWVYLYDGAGNELYKVQLVNAGNNSKQVVNLGNTKGVMKMKVVLDGRNEMGHLAGSGAIDDIRFCVEEEAEKPCEDVQGEVEMTIATQAKAYPNPFNESATVEFITRRSESYVVNLYSTKGSLIRQLKVGTSKAREVNKVEVDGRDLAEGMYLVRIVSDSEARTVKLLLKK